MRALSGDNLVRIGFLDEAGRSRHEPIIVVAGIIINGDRTYRKLEERLTQTKRLLPAKDRAGFLFHAVDIFQGTGYFRNKNLWPRERRYPILRDLAKIPR